jgi:hypothetical protein
MIPFNPLSSPLPSPSSPPNPVFCTFITFFSVLVASFRAMKCMKALFTRSNRAHSKDNVKDPKDSDSLSPSASHQKGKLPQLPPLREWPPPSPPLEQPQSGSPTSITSYKPLPELSFLPLIDDSLVHFADYDPRSISHFGAPSLMSPRKILLTQPSAPARHTLALISTLPGEARARLATEALP